MRKDEQMNTTPFPTTAVIHITESCTHECAFCYARKTLGLSEEADYQTLCKIVDKLSFIGITNICLLGGDPVNYPFAIDLLRYIKEIPSMKTSVMSNTYIPSNGSFDDLCKYLDFAEATIHGISSSDHDAVCGVIGAYDNLVDKLSQLSANGVVVGLAINITPKTYDHIFDIVNNFNGRLSNRLSYIVVQRIIPAGKAKEGSDHHLTKHHANIALEHVHNISENLRISISIEDPFPLCVIDKKYHKYMHRCEWGFTKFSLTANGNFSRCGATPNQSLGNILNDDFHELWSTVSHLKEFRALNYLSEKCKTCKQRIICGGGCPVSNQSNRLGIDYLIDANEVLI